MPILDTSIVVMGGFRDLKTFVEECASPPSTSTERPQVYSYVVSKREAKTTPARARLLNPKTRCKFYKIDLDNGKSVVVRSDEMVMVSSGNFYFPDALPSSTPFMSHHDLNPAKPVYCLRSCSIKKVDLDPLTTQYAIRDDFSGEGDVN